MCQLALMMILITMQDQDKVVICPYSGEFFVRRGALKKLLERGAVYEKQGQYYKSRDITDEE